MGQLAFDAVEVPPHRVRSLAGVLAGFRYPGRGSYEQLTKPQKRAVESAARAVLERLAAEPD